MAQDVCLIRDDTGRTLTLLGATQVTVLYDGVVTDHPVPDRNSVSDGVLTRPRSATIVATVTPGRAVEEGATLSPGGFKVGTARIEEVVGFLEQVQSEGVVLSMAQPGLPLLPLMAVERWTTILGNRDGFELNIQLKGIRLATARGIQVARNVGPARDELRAGLSNKTPTGTGTATRKTVGVQFGEYLGLLEVRP